MLTCGFIAKKNTTFMTYGSLLNNRFAEAPNARLDSIATLRPLLGVDRYREIINSTISEAFTESNPGLS
jgi:hypothetical protein